MTRDCVYDQGFAAERARLSAMESLWDPGSQALLRFLPVALRESARRAVVDAGPLPAEDADAVAAGFGENIRLLTPLVIAGIGRRT